MDRKTFNLKMKEMLEKNLPSNAKVILQQVRKTNNVMLDSLIIQMSGCNISPTIYLESFYEMYCRGMELDDVMIHILAAYYKGKPKRELNMDFFRDFEKTKDRIVYRLINAQQNKELLEEIPHILFLDLAICFYYAFCDEQLGDGMITICNKHMEWWGTNYQELFALARENTPRLFPAEYKSMKMVITELYGEALDEACLEPCQLYVLTNKQKCQGAVCLLYEGELERIARHLEGNLYILPSSVHEVIVFKEEGDEDAEILHKMIKDVNEKHLEPEEVLSDYPYHYDWKQRKLVCLRNF